MSLKLEQPRANSNSAHGLSGLPGPTLYDLQVGKFYPLHMGGRYSD
jgi:hypothetical protein